MDNDGTTVFNWHRLPVLAIKLYCQGTWLTWRCEEMMWSPFNNETSNALDLKKSDMALQNRGPKESAKSRTFSRGSGCTVSMFAGME